MINLNKDLTRLPVQFASEALYIVAKHGISGDVDGLVACVKAKVANLHSDGVSQVVFALTHLNRFDDAALWASLHDHIKNKKFRTMHVQHNLLGMNRWYHNAHQSALEYGETLSKYENGLYYKDEIAFYRTLASLEQAKHLGAPSSVDVQGMIDLLMEKEVFNKAHLGVYIDLFWAENHGIDIESTFYEVNPKIREHSEE